MSVSDVITVDYMLTLGILLASYPLERVINLPGWQVSGVVLGQAKQKAL